MAKGKAALGRGLGALIPTDPEGDRSGGTLPDPGHRKLYDFQDRVSQLGRVADVPLEEIDPNPYQPRQTFDETALDELAASISQLGVIQPVTVRAADDGRFEIISGERRVRAARLAGLTSVPAYVREADTEAMLEMALVENVQREELNPIEVAMGYQRLIDECALTQEEVATKVGKSRTTVTNFLRLLRLPDRAQAGLRDGVLTVGHARAMVPIDDPAMLEKLLDAIIRDGLSVRAVEDRVRAWHARRLEPAPEVPVTRRATSQRDLLLGALTDRLRSSLSTKVAIRPNATAEGGRIEVAYYSDEDLERLIELMGT